MVLRNGRGRSLRPSWRHRPRHDAEVPSPFAAKRHSLPAQHPHYLLRALHQRARQRLPQISRTLSPLRVVTVLDRHGTQRPMTGPILISEEALFRHGVVSVVTVLVAGGFTRPEAIAAATREPYTVAGGQLRRVHPRTLSRWLEAFDAGGIQALEPKSRKRTNTSLVLDEKLVRFLRTERKKDREASIPELLRRGKEHGMIQSIEDVDRTTVWRAMRRMDLDTRRTKRHRD